jgi:hypothetical protein
VLRQQGQQETMECEVSRTGTGRSLTSARCLRQPLRHESSFQRPVIQGLEVHRLEE